MSSALRYRSFVLLIAITVSIGGCGGAFQNFNIVSDAQEMQMGQEFSKEIESALKMYDDPAVVKYIDDLGQRLAGVSRRANITYTIKVVDTDDVNAFAVPGGYLYVNRGLISHAETESELAGVMGHEVGHIVGRHGSKQISKQYGLQFITAMILGGGNPGMSR
jgi:predicted Zn-dependent protease